MSFYTGFDFFLVLILVLIPASILGFCKSKYLKIYRAFSTALFIFLIYRNTPAQLWLLLGYVVFALILSKLYIFIKSRELDSEFVFHIMICLSIALLVIYKLSIFGEDVCGFIGISYICFRSVQVIIEIHDGLINDINGFQYLSFILFFPSLSSGPIDRSRRFNADDDKIWSREEYGELFENGVFKLILGAFYKIVCSNIVYGWNTHLFEQAFSIPIVIGRAYTYGLYLFFDFAGYSAMAVGTAYILGIRLPDNFKQPFLSIDIKDFWNRWHISLSTWFRDYIFNRFMMKALKDKWFSNRINAASAGYMVNMVIMGAWHGLTPAYITYGIYHGALLAITEVFQKKIKLYKKVKDKIWFKIISWFVTLNLVMFGFLIFSGYVNDTITNYLLRIM